MISLKTLTPVVTNILALLQGMIASQAKSKKIDQAKDARNKSLLKSLFKTLVNLSLSSECQKQFKTLNVLDILYPLCQNFIQNIEQVMGTRRINKNLTCCRTKIVNLFWLVSEV